MHTASGAAADASAAAGHMAAGAAMRVAPGVIGAVHLSVLGEFSVRRDGRPIAVAPGAARLLALLAVRTRPVLRTTAWALLWPDQPDARAAASLRNALWRCRGALGDVVVSTTRSLSLSPEVDVDLWRRRTTAHRLYADGARNAGPCAIDELEGELLPDWDEEWLSPERERVRQLGVHALETICRDLSAVGRTAEAIDAGVAAVATDPLRESAQRVLIEAHLAEGNLSEAHRQLAMYRAVLLEQLGAQPSTSLMALVASRAQPELI